MDEILPHTILKSCYAPRPTHLPSGDRHEYCGCQLLTSDEIAEKSKRGENIMTILSSTYMIAKS